MAHGYLGDDYGIDGGTDRDRDDNRWRDERADGRREWRGDRGMMFRNDPDRGWSDDSGWSDRGWARGQGLREDRDRFEAGRSYSANPDDHYRSWRDRHMSEVDRDYADYCREREEQFHRDFDSWRRLKYSNPQPLRTGMTQSGLSHDPSGMTQAQEDSEPPTANAPDPTADATLGTNSSGPRARRG